MSESIDNLVVSTTKSLDDPSTVASAAGTEVATKPQQEISSIKVAQPLIQDQQDIHNEWNMMHIASVYAQVKKEHDEREQIRLQYFMSNHCDKVLRDSVSTKRKRDTSSFIDFYSEANPSDSQSHRTTVQQHQQQQQEGTSHNTSQNHFSVQFRTHGRKSMSRTQSVSPTPISAKTTATTQSLSSKSSYTDRHSAPLPPYMFCVPTTESYRVDDQPELTFVPVLEKYDDKPLSRRNILSMHQTSYREEVVLFGSKCQQERTNMILDTLFQRLFRGPNENEYVTVPSWQHKVWDIIAKVTQTPRLQVIRRLRDHACSKYDNNTKTPESDDPLGTNDSANTKNDSRKRNRLDALYEASTDAYRKLWCRQCYVYDCNMHGLNEKPSVAVQTMLAKAKARDGFWVGKNQRDRNANITVPTSNHEINEMSEVGKQIFKQLYSIFEGNFSDISGILRLPIHVVERHFSSIEEKSDLLDVMQSLGVRKKSQYNYYSVKNYKLEWYNQYRDSKMFSFFYPCLHDDVCKDTFNCTCVDNRFFCTDACSWNVNSPNYYRGCNCKGHCGQKCSCFLSKRECDPNLCQCQTCTDPPNQAITKQRCRNDNLKMNRSPSLLIGISSVSGWGLYTRHALHVGEYVGKYIGEMMSQDEADRRGLIADARDCTYMFLISTDMSIDAGRKGNKLRFINHSENPNLEPRSEYQ